MKRIASFITLAVAFVLVIGISVVYTYKQQEKYYDMDGTAHINLYDVSFTDTKGNRYTFDFDKSGYERLYVNDTDEYLNANLCYVDSNGYLYYDDDMSITAKGTVCCADADGTIYYPAKFTTFQADGAISYIYNSGNLKYDRLGKAYTFDCVPYYDKAGNKYLYSFDSSSQKGFYTKISTKEAFDNEYAFVDENGYFVYDKAHSFVKQAGTKNTYKDSSGKIYYWASGISWDKEGNLLDSFGAIIN